MPTTKAQEITAEIRRMIVGGMIAGGAHLEEKPMADRLGVSRTPVRDAFSILAGEGLLEYFPNRGYVVKTYNIKEIIDAFTVRAELEGMTCRLLAEAPPPAPVQQALRNLVDRADEVLACRAWDRDARGAWHAANVEFHLGLADATGNSHLMRFTRQLRRFPLIFDNRLPIRDGAGLETLFSREQGIVANGEHRRILALIAAGDARRADHLMQEHIQTNADVLKQAVGGAEDA